MLLGASPASASPVTIIHAGWVLAEPGEAPRRDQSIVVREDRIERIENGYIEPADLTGGAPGATVIDMRTKFVLPGLIDCHVHITSESAPGFKLRRLVQSGPDQAISGAMNARRTLMAGFTTVRDTAGSRSNDFEAVFALRDGIAAGKVAGSRLVVSGQGITPTAGHGDFMGYRPDIEAMLAPSGICDGADECTKATRYMIKRGADFIKIAVTGGVTSEISAGLDQQMTDSEIQAVVDTARALGRKVAAHAHGTQGINSALRAGVASIEHGTYMDEESIRLFRETGAYLVPTMLADQAVAQRIEADPNLPAAVRAKSQDRTGHKIEQVRLAYEAGVNMAFGTDSAISPHGENAQEFALLAAAGVEASDAVRMATVNAADLLGLADQIGTLAPGKLADIIAVPGNPIEDITELENVAFVMKDGVVFKIDDLEFAVP